MDKTKLKRFLDICTLDIKILLQHCYFEIWYDSVNPDNPYSNFLCIYCSHLYIRAVEHLLPTIQELASQVGIRNAGVVEALAALEYLGSQNIKEEDPRRYLDILYLL